MIKIFIPGQPQGKGRARSRIVTNKATGHQFTAHHTPTKTRQYEDKIRSHAIGVMQNSKPLNCPISLELEMVFEVPKSWPKWKTALALSGQIMPTVKPDSDNIEKAVMDGFNGVVWKDDCLVVHCNKVKIYGERAGIRAEIYQIKDKYSATCKRSDIEGEGPQKSLIDSGGGS